MGHGGVGEQRQALGKSLRVQAEARSCCEEQEAAAAGSPAEDEDSLCARRPQRAP